VKTLIEINKLYNSLRNLNNYEDAVFYNFLAIAFAAKKAGGRGKELDALDSAVYDALAVASFDATKKGSKVSFFFSAVKIWLAVEHKRTVRYDSYFAAVASVLGVVRWEVYQRKPFAVRNYSCALRLARRDFYDYIESVKARPDGIDGVRREVLELQK
jgi:hypothetical protein